MFKEEITSYCKNCFELEQQLDQNKDRLKRKEQECERLKEYFKIAKEASNCNLKALGEMTEWADKLDEENDQLKAENEKYSLFIEKLCDYAGLECDSEEQAMRTLSDLASQMNKARWIIDRYKQTLTEIKEIVSIGLVDGLQPEEYSGFLKILQAQILQKISECEVENES